jgi:glycosyltransferase involved in cell wall biosynthesis
MNLSFDKCTISVVLPCLNEKDTVGLCVKKAKEALKNLKIQGEIIGADNGSHDGSGEIAKEAGARVILVNEKGYGNAVLGGVRVAEGDYIIMADADDSYDLSDIEPFVLKFKEGYDVVIGCRFPKGGGKIHDGAMPLLHRWVGTPVFSLLISKFFGVKLFDINCGFRGFRKSFFDSLNLTSSGMELASEIIVKTIKNNGKIAEIPIVLYKDGRHETSSHLRTFRDGLRHLLVILKLKCSLYLDKRII